MKNIYLPLLIFVLVLGLIGCAEKPGSVGNGLPNTDGTFSIVDTTFFSKGDTTYTVALIPGFALTNLAGRLSSTEELITLVKFSPGSTVELLRGAAIDTAEIRLTVNYRFAAHTPTVTFSIVEVLSSWSQGTFTSDSLPMLMLGSKIVGTLSDSMTYSSSVKTLLDTVEVRKWVNASLDTNAAPFYGFALQAQPGVTTGVIGFGTFNNFTSFVPQLFIRYTKDGVRDSMTIFSGEDTYAVKSSGPKFNAPLTVRGAFGVRSKLSFDLSALVNNPIVNNATLTLTLDTTASQFGGFSPDTVTALLGMSNTIADLSDSTVFIYGYRTAPVSGQPPKYSFSMTRIADFWVRSVRPNYGLTLRWGAEYGTTEKAVFYSSTAADSSQRPILKVIYSKK